MTRWICAFLAAALAAGTADFAWAVPVPILDPGFNVFVDNDGADFDNDDDVDGADFLTWQRGLGQGGQTTNAAGDADFNATVEGPDLDAWESQFGAPPNIIVANDRQFQDNVHGMGARDHLQLGGSSFFPIPPGQFGDVPAGWTSFTGVTGRMRADGEFDVPTGTMAFTVTTATAGNPGGNAGFEQTLVGVTLLPETTYTLSIDVSDRDTFRLLTAIPDFAGAPPAEKIHLDLLAGGVALDAGSPSVAAFARTFVAPPNGFTSTYTVQLTTGSDVSATPGDLAIRFSADPHAPPIVGGTTRTYFDNVALDATPVGGVIQAPVPEPSAAALTLLAVAGLSSLRRRHRRG